MKSEIILAANRQESFEHKSPPVADTNPATPEANSTSDPHAPTQ